MKPEIIIKKLVTEKKTTWDGDKEDLIMKKNLNMVPRTLLSSKNQLKAIHTAHTRPFTFKTKPWSYLYDFITCYFINISVR